MTIAEKDKLDQVIRRQVDNARVDYQNKRSKNRPGIQIKIVNAAAVIALKNKYNEANENLKDIALKLRKLYCIPQMNWDNNGFIINTDYNHPTLKAYDEETTQKGRDFYNLQDQFTLKLFAEGAEAQEIIDQLMEELKKLSA